MRLVIQRVDSASVKISNKIYNKIDKGYLIYVCFEKGDTGKNIDKVVSKIISLRIFEDSMGKMNKSILEVSNTSILLISQFTLAGDIKKTNRPSFTKTLEKGLANNLYLLFFEKLNNFIKTKQGIFGADMIVESINNGPATIIYDMENV